MLNSWHNVFAQALEPKRMVEVYQRPNVRLPQANGGDMVEAAQDVMADFLLHGADDRF